MKKTRARAAIARAPAQPGFVAERGSRRWCSSVPAGVFPCRRRRDAESGFCPAPHAVRQKAQEVAGTCRMEERPGTDQKNTAPTTAMAMGQAQSGSGLGSGPVHRTVMTEAPCQNDFRKDQDQCQQQGQVSQPAGPIAPRSVSTVFTGPPTVVLASRRIVDDLKLPAGVGLLAGPLYRRGLNRFRCSPGQDAWRGC